MTSKVMLGLGKYRFSLETAAYQQFQKTTAYLWPSQQRIGQHAQLQYVGPGSKEITLPGVIYPRYKGGFDQMKKMEDEAGKGEPLLLVTGTGSILGLWVIESISETGSIFLGNGAPRKIEFSLKLSYYGPAETATISPDIANQLNGGTNAITSTLKLITNRLELPQAGIENAFKSLGIDLYDGTGNLRPMANLLGDIKSVSKNFDTSSQITLIQQLLGNDAATQAASAGFGDVFQTLANQLGVGKDYAGLADQLVDTIGGLF
ncbi:phage tail protein [Rheinheimera sp.]|uniref:phage tail protein n=1 Tax=Rheinheimera sp. TaxID=1869214 RepID=UPI00307D3661